MIMTNHLKPVYYDDYPDQITFDKYLSRAAVEEYKTMKENIDLIKWKTGKQENENKLFEG